MVEVASWRWFSLTAVLVFAGILAGCNSTDLLVVGSKAPAVRTKTLSDAGGDLSQLTSYRYPDERMYTLSLDQAMKEGKTIVLEFATPGHCTVCDKQLQMLKAMLAKYERDVIFLHMDQYMNPGAFKAFQVKGDPWTYIIDKNGVVQFKRPGRLLYAELDPVLARMVEKK